MIEVFAELTRGNVRLDIAAGRGDDAHVYRHFDAAADTLESLIDQDAQNLVLRFARHIGNLVDKQGAAVRFLERADFATRRSVAAFDAE